MNWPEGAFFENSNLTPNVYSLVKGEKITSLYGSIYKMGKLCIVSFCWSSVTEELTNNDVIASVPATIKPTVSTTSRYFGGILIAGTNTYAGVYMINSNGQIYQQHISTGAKSGAGTLVYICE